MKGEVRLRGIGKSFGETRVLPEELPRTAERLRPVFARLAGAAR